MTLYHPENERLKRRYFEYLKDAQRYSEDSVDAAAQALHRFETYTKFKPFRAFHIEQAKAFKRHLAGQVNQRTKERLSKATLYSTLAALRKFFFWLAGQPRFKSRISYSDSEYFNMSEKDARVAKARREQPVPSVEQILHVIKSMPAGTDLQLRDRALIATTLLTGARDGALASLKLKHLELAQGKLFQDARQVNTKFSKTFTTWFFPVPPEVRTVVEHWVHYLRAEKLWGPDDPLFPATHIIQNAEHRFQAGGLDRKHWSSANPIRGVFKESFKAAGLPYFNPHSFRNTLASLGERVCRTPEDFKAWSQNLGHEKVMTTFSSYGKVGSERQAEIMRGLGEPPASDEDLRSKLEKLIRRGR